MRNLLIASILFAVETLPALAAPIKYAINFTVTEGASPQAATFTYDPAAQTFSDFQVIWDLAIFDLTTSANAPNIVGTVPCLHGLTGAAATFEFLEGKCATGPQAARWGASDSGPPHDCFPVVLVFEYGSNSVSGPFFSIGASNLNAGAQFEQNGGGFAITANPKIGVFHGTGTMSAQREQHTATLLADGKVLVAGGQNATGTLASAELYDPKAGSFANTHSMITGRYAHTATLLPNGKVLIAGGDSASGTLMSAELYDPATGKFSATGSMITARYSHAATLLPDGKVLIAGGFSSSTPITKAELYDPATGTFSATGSMTTARAAHTATLLPSGKVLIAGGYGGPSTVTSPDIVGTEELYNAKTGIFAAAGSMAVGRAGQTATLLGNGKVLLAGGNGYIYAGLDKSGPIYDFGVLNSGELYGDSPEIVLPYMNLGRVNHTATLLPDGKVLVAGGAMDDAQVPAQLYGPKYETFSDTGLMGSTRHFHTATLLSNGKVLIVGGANNTHALASAELFESSTGGPY